MALTGKTLDAKKYLYLSLSYALLGIPNTLDMAMTGRPWTPRSIYIYPYTALSNLGIPNTLDMALTGKTLDAKKAKKVGLVDAVVDPLGKFKLYLPARRYFKVDKKKSNFSYEKPYKL